MALRSHFPSFAFPISHVETRRPHQAPLFAPAPRCARHRRAHRFHARDPLGRLHGRLPQGL